MYVYIYIIYVYTRVSSRKPQRAESLQTVTTSKVGRTPAEFWASPLRQVSVFPQPASEAIKIYVLLTLLVLILTHIIS